MIDDWVCYLRAVVATRHHIARVKVEPGRRAKRDKNNMCFALLTHKRQRISVAPPEEDMPSLAVLTNLSRNGTA